MYEVRLVEPNLRMAYTSATMGLPFVEVLYLTYLCLG